jgi:hypothetical protein
MCFRKNLGWKSQRCQGVIGRGRMKWGMLNGNQNRKPEEDRCDKKYKTTTTTKTLEREDLIFVTPVHLYAEMEIRILSSRN